MDIIICIAIFLACLIVFAISYSRGKDKYGCFNVLVPLSSIIGGIVFLSIPFIYINESYDYKIKIEQFKADRATITSSRVNSDLERIKVIDEIIKDNDWLATTKFYKHVWFEAYMIPNEIDSLEPIQ